MNEAAAARTEVPAQHFASIVRLEGVQKYFGPVQALRDIDQTDGEKSTLGIQRSLSPVWKRRIRGFVR